jgi:hypothetical protein
MGHTNITSLRYYKSVQEKTWPASTVTKRRSVNIDNPFTAFDYLFHPVQRTGIFAIYLIIKELRFLPDFSSNIYLDKFAIPQIYIILHICHYRFVYFLLRLQASKLSETIRGAGLGGWALGLSWAAVCGDVPTTELTSTTT